MTEEFFDARDLQLNGESDFTTHWGNFGYWQSVSTYPAACEALARLVADAARLDAQSHLLDCGFGCGEQLLTWINHYQVAAIAGVNISMSQTVIARRKMSALSSCAAKVTLHQGDAVALLADQALTTSVGDTSPFSHVIALDCAYHFQVRADFLQHAYDVLASNGRLALSDITFCKPPVSLIGKVRFHFAVMCMSAANIPAANVMSVEEYGALLAHIGFKDIEIRDVTKPVIAGFCAWLPGYRQRSRLSSNTQWTKYTVTTLFLRWAYRYGIIEYQLISASK